METSHPYIGRFAPSPTGRMHLGNAFTALLSWLAARAAGGRWILRIEDLDPQRSRREFAAIIEDDLSWLGLDWDEGGLDNRGPAGPYSQSERSAFYTEALEKLKATGLAYPCTCTRAELHATGAPHSTDGRLIYPGNCRPAILPTPWQEPTRPAAVRLAVPDCDMDINDRLYGHRTVNLATHCGDFVLRRADGAWAYQLAVVVDDAMMGVTEIVRGNDLLLSVAQQDYLRNLLGYPKVDHIHVPLVCNLAGQRLSKRDSSLSLEAIRSKTTPEAVIGRLAFMAGLIPEPTPTKAADLVPFYDIKKLTRTETVIVDGAAEPLSSPLTHGPE